MLRDLNRANAAEQLSGFCISNTLWFVFDRRNKKRSACCRSFRSLILVPAVESHARRFTRGPAPSCAPPMYTGELSPEPPCSLPTAEKQKDRREGRSFRSHMLVPAVESHARRFTRWPAPSWTPPRYKGECFPLAPLFVSDSRNKKDRSHDRSFRNHTLVPAVGIEPTWSCPRRILSPLRLPVSPRRHGHNVTPSAGPVKRKGLQLQRGASIIPRLC